MWSRRRRGFSGKEDYPEPIPNARAAEIDDRTGPPLNYCGGDFFVCDICGTSLTDKKSELVADPEHPEWDPEGNEAGCFARVCMDYCIDKLSDFGKAEDERRRKRTNAQSRAGGRRRSGSTDR
jgi:hypothetical protein